MESNEDATTVVIEKTRERKMNNQTKSVIRIAILVAILGDRTNTLSDFRAAWLTILPLPSARAGRSTLTRRPHSGPASRPELPLRQPVRNDVVPANDDAGRLPV